MASKSRIHGEDEMRLRASALPIFNWTSILAGIGVVGYGFFAVLDIAKWRAEKKRRHAFENALRRLKESE